MVVAVADGHGIPLSTSGRRNVWLSRCFSGADHRDDFHESHRKKIGLLDALTSDLMAKFGRSPATMLAVVTLIIMFPGMITGSCTSSVLSTGVMMIPVC